MNATRSADVKFPRGVWREGDPALDVGNCVAHIAEYSLRAFADPDRLAAAEAALKDQFLAS
jgi:hypothetical protein